MCFDIKITTIALYNDGLRGINNFTWTYTSSAINATVDANLTEICKNATDNQLNYIVIPALTLDSF